MMNYTVDKMLYEMDSSLIDQLLWYTPAPVKKMFKGIMRQYIVYPCEVV